MKSDPWGCNRFAGEKLGNALVRNVLRIIRMCNAFIVIWVLENPAPSRLFQLFPVKSLMSAAESSIILVDQCMYCFCDPVSGYYRKRILFVVSSTKLSAIELKCDGSHPYQHVDVLTVVNGHSAKRSEVAAHYPDQLCSAFANCVCSAQSVVCSFRQPRLLRT